MGQLFPAFPD